MKKCLVLLLFAALLTGCGAKSPQETGATTDTIPTTAQTEPTMPSETAPTESMEQASHTVWLWTQQSVTDNKSTGGVYTRSYDKNGNLLTDVYAANDGKVAYNKAYTYDADGRLVSYASYDSHSATGLTEYVYDAEGRLTMELFSNNEGYSAKTDYTYGGAGELVGKVTISGKTEDRTVYVYDEAGRLSREEQTTRSGNKGTRFVRLVYTYDAAGNLLSQEESRNGNLVQTQRWTYNEAGQKLSYQVTYGTENYLEEVKYLYFADGKLDQETFYKGGKADTAVYYIYDDAGKVTKKTTGTPYETFISVSQNVLYTYDENGNLLTEVTATKDGTELSRREYTYIALEVPVK